MKAREYLEFLMAVTGASFLEGARAVLDSKGELRRSCQSQSELLGSEKKEACRKYTE
jgi:hypothetical protein